MESQHATNTVVVLVSWLRDAGFWKEGTKKIGVDPQQRLHIVDALSTGLGISPSADIPVVEKTILEAIKKAQGDSQTKVLLILDGLDFLLAATAVPVIAITDMLLELCEHAHSTIVTAVADTPLMQSPTTPLEVSHAALVMGMAHQASLVMSVRELDTGVAKDVSGVLRITRGGGEGDDEGLGKEEVVEMEVREPRECLYLVGGDGGVRVFERGA